MFFYYTSLGWGEGYSVTRDYQCLSYIVTDGEKSSPSCIINLNQLYWCNLTVYNIWFIIIKQYHNLMVIHFIDLVRLHQPRSSQKKRPYHTSPSNWFVNKQNTVRYVFFLDTVLLLIKLIKYKKKHVYHHDYRSKSHILDALQ